MALLRARPLLHAVALALGCLAACRAPQLSASPAAVAAAPEIARYPVGVVTRSGGRHVVSAELVATEAARRQGLMHRTQMGADDGMIFAFAAEAPRSFWMRNPLIPLDMIFARGDGTITGIVANATPLTDTPRRSGGPAAWVLEVNGGWCALHGVAAGDRLDLSAIPPQQPQPDDR